MPKQVQYPNKQYIHRILQNVLLLNSINAGFIHSTSTYSELYTMFKINKRRTHNNRINFTHHNNCVRCVRIFCLTKFNAVTKHNRLKLKQKLIKHCLTEASSGHSGTALT